MAARSTIPELFERLGEAPAKAVWKKTEVMTLNQEARIVWNCYVGYETNQLDIITRQLLKKVVTQPSGAKKQGTITITTENLENSYEEWKTGKLLDQMNCTDIV